MDESVKQLGALAIVIVVVVAIVTFATDSFIPAMQDKMNDQLDKITYQVQIDDRI